MDELSLLRQTPHSAEAEQAALGSMLIDARCIPDLLAELRLDDFYLTPNRDIFTTIHAMFAAGEKIDPITVLSQMQERGVYNDSSRNYMGQVLQATPTAANAMEYAAVLKDRSLLRRLIETGTAIVEQAYAGAGPASEQLDAAEQNIYDIRHGRSRQNLHSISGVLIEVYRKLDLLAQNKGKLPGLPTGLSDLDNYIGGLGDSNLILIASRPGMGKTSIALNMALRAAKESGKAVVFFSLEMSLEQLGMRLLAGEALVDSKLLQTGAVPDAAWADITRAAAELSKLSLFFNESSNITVTQMKAECRKVENLGLIVIDYLQLMQGSRNFDNRVQEVGEISRSLKIMAKELNVPVLCLSQLSRANEKRADKRPMLSDLRESGAIEQDADVVLFLHRESYYDPDAEYDGDAECIVAKNRHGDTGIVHLQWLSQYTTFTAQEWRNES